jgi:hypothetical protein
MCGPLFQSDESLEKRSPTGLYRLNITIKRQAVQGFRGYNEHIQFVFSKRNEVMTTYGVENTDQLDPSFHEMHPDIEWVSETVLRAGSDDAEDPFKDKLVISNHLEQSIKYLRLGYGSYQSFWIFDIPAKGSVVLLASPSFRADGPANYTVGYEGRTSQEKPFDGSVSGKKRYSPTEGPNVLEITLENDSVGVR